MINPYPIVVLASQLIAVAARDIPDFDIERSCKAEGDKVESVQRCSQDEKKARDQLQAQWSQFESTTKSTCTLETSSDGTRSYVELLTCLEMARDAKKLEKTPSK